MHFKKDNKIRHALSFTHTQQAGTHTHAHTHSQTHMHTKVEEEG